MDWKGPSAAALFAAIVLFAGFWMKPVFPLGDDRWLVAACICGIGVVVIYSPSILRLIRGRKATPIADESVVDYVMAGEIVNRYIDPDRSMGRVRIAVRAQILERFAEVGGSRVGESHYDGQLLHDWLQKNAARALVKCTAPGFLDTS